MAFLPLTSAVKLFALLFVWFLYMLDYAKVNVFLSFFQWGIHFQKRIGCCLVVTPLLTKLLFFFLFFLSWSLERSLSTLAYCMFLLL